MDTQTLEPTTTAPATLTQYPEPTPEVPAPAVPAPDVPPLLTLPRLLAGEEDEGFEPHIWRGVD
ncbi:hypothetical protein PJ985_18450 [Streptomyces sp. ACA25]|uniref:hypothetical protein n=1 Tax=Streptomyces sp. ACA25 TaxID=3022596 RepID=UPI002307B785|nr:hypothetical protein [Streptomyces sp. ACA25]MDB1089543.1 hypothetical protein [Streptomyces sp. ACA25]